MSTHRRNALVLVVMLLAVACSGSGGGPSTPTSSAIPRGGTLRVGTLIDFGSALDPQKEYVEWEFFRCCLLRTLLSYPGLPAADGGNELHPDIAQAMPDVSQDGLTWTFHLRTGLTYAPPFQDTPIVAGDFVRALEREADPKASAGGYSFYYSVIKGFDDVTSGRAKHISGLSTPDDSTLVVQLTKPAGELGFLFAMPATAPIPPGAADGHQTDYGRFLVSSGPYMIEGADKIEVSAPPDQQQPASGFQPGKSLVLVRNPSWDPSSDDLRDAYVDRIEVSFGGSADDLARKVEAGDLDVFFHGPPPAEAISHFSSDPQLQGQLHVNAGDRPFFISMNLAVPPFDDVHIRKAANLVIDKEGLRRLAGGEDIGQIARHIIPDGLLGGTLADYDPYATDGDHGNVEAANAEVKQSAYDSNGDGVCDAPACSDVLAITVTDDPYPKQAALITQDFAEIGIKLDVKSLEYSTAFAKCNDPSTMAALCLSGAWGKDFPDPSTFAGPLFGSSSIGPDGCCNFSLVGASPDQLRSFGYSVTEVPSVDRQIATCSPLVGQDRTTCFANLDKTLMENVVPWIPYLVANQVEIVSSRVVNYTFDQFSNGMALDHVAVEGA